MKHKISQLMAKKFLNYQYQLPEYNPTADFEWIQDNSRLPWLQLDIEVPYQTILNEIKNIENLLVDHRDDYGEHQGWKSFCIHGKSYDATREDSYYNDDRPHGWTTEVQQHMPQTFQYFSKIWPGSEYRRIRVMLLEPGGYVSIHRDSKMSKLTAVNIAITQPPECNFIMENHGVVPFANGLAFWLDLSNHHVVMNNSQQQRWHIIVHQQAYDDPKFQDLVVNSYKRLYNSQNANSHNHNP
jgi:hypothetical protein